MLTSLFKTHALALSLAINPPVPANIGSYDQLPWDGGKATPEHAIIITPEDLAPSGFPASLARELGRDARIQLQKTYEEMHAAARFLIELDQHAVHSKEFEGIDENLAMPWSGDKDQKIKSGALTSDETVRYGGTLINQMNELYNSASKMMEHGGLTEPEKDDVSALKDKLMALQTVTTDALVNILPQRGINISLKNQSGPT